MNSKPKSFSYLFSYLSQYRISLVLTIFLMLIESGVSLVIPWFAGQFAKAVFAQELLFGLTTAQVFIVWVALFSVQAVLRYLSVFRLNLIGSKILTNLSCRLYEHIQMLPMGYFIDRKKGAILSLLSNDIAIISHFLSGILTSLVPSALILIGAAFMMVSIHSVTGLVILALIPLFYVVLKLLGKGLAPISQELVAKQAGQLAISSENISQIKLIKTFNREDHELHKFKAKADELYRLRKKQLHLQALLSPFIQLMVSCGVLAVILITVVNYQAGALGMSDIISLLMYGFLFVRPISNLAHLYGQVQQAKGASHRILETLNTLPEPVDEGTKSVTITGSITLKDVTFSYTPGQAVIRGLSFDIRPGQIVVLRGPNGRGKSTILHLLMRFIEPQQGTIFMDGYNIHEINLRALRQQIGLVSQEVSLYEGTINDNIAFGYPQATSAEIEKAARKAGAHRFIEQLDKGYMTPVGEEGVKLSGGQRQKIALARALMSKPKIMLLDEPTSMFDMASSIRFKDQFASILKDMTVIIASHDDELVKLADQVLEF
ncbi:ATP-binding cassette, subfamily B, MsbA [Reinekea marinisedimentorum]|uniref:ATP-binding cassette, subfamily B, MsbA n=2 Tax=Reinekea marinisedimentorum TaxID=230495 RepID=A0A4R3HY63_9GAMM|nr:ATP-binding cassette, subfamily B, MsbA [Reinekea marinisedimentorum]